MNESLPLTYEVATDDPKTWLTDEESMRLLSKNTDGRQSGEPQSLLNFTNSKFLADNLNNASAVMKRFGLGSEVKAAALISYYN